MNLREIRSQIRAVKMTERDFSSPKTMAARSGPCDREICFWRQRQSLLSAKDSFCAFLMITAIERESKSLHLVRGWHIYNIQGTTQWWGKCFPLWDCRRYRCSQIIIEVWGSGSLQGPARGSVSEGPERRHLSHGSVRRCRRKQPKDMDRGVNMAARSGERGWMQLENWYHELASCLCNRPGFQVSSGNFPLKLISWLRTVRGK